MTFYTEGEETNFKTKVSEDLCPKCENSNIKFKAFQHTENGGYYPCKCSNELCAFEFRQWYSLIFTNQQF